MSIVYNMWSAVKKPLKLNSIKLYGFIIERNKSKYRNLVPGLEYLRNPSINKGMAFTIRERQLLGIHGLLPPGVRTQDTQLEVCLNTFNKYEGDMYKYLYLTELHERHEQLFFRLVSENVKIMMPIIYTPTVGQACKTFGLIYRRPQGLFISYKDKSHIHEVLKNWPTQSVKAIVVTDGERILGLGDLGAAGMGIPIGKLALYTALAGVKPRNCLPITLDVGTNNKEFQDDPMYIGLRMDRITGSEYDEFVDEFMCAVVNTFGQNVLIQFEDFANHHAYPLLERYRYQYCVFNDDIQGTAAVVLAGVLASLRITDIKITDNVYFFYGAGAAGTGIADLIVRAMMMEGIDEEEGASKIYMMDIDGLLTSQRPEGLPKMRSAIYAKDLKPSKDLRELIETIKPTILIGASAHAKAFTPEVLQEIAKHTKRPVIMALSNPTEKAECTAEEAYSNTEGRAIFASGSPFDVVSFNGKEYHPGQGNNAYAFPGIGLGVIVANIRHIPEEIFIIAAQTIANSVSVEMLELGSIYPPMECIRDLSVQIAINVIEFAYENDLASLYPQPDNLREYVTESLYNYYYVPSIPATWDISGVKQ